MASCSQCGSGFPDEAKLCTSCGAPVSSASIAPRTRAGGHPWIAYLASPICWLVGPACLLLGLKINDIVGPWPLPLFISLLLGLVAVGLIGGFPVGLLSGYLCFGVAARDTRSNAGFKFLLWSAWPTVILAFVLTYQPFQLQLLLFHLFNIQIPVAAWASSLLYGFIVCLGALAGFMHVLTKYCTHEWEIKVSKDKAPQRVCKHCGLTGNVA